MNTQLKYIANIQTGLFAKPKDKGEVVYLQTKHFDEKGNRHGELHLDLMAEDISDNHILRHGDVLFAAKGTKNFAVVYETHNKPAVASTSFFVIRITEQNVIPEYLCWFLNCNYTQAFLKKRAIGTSIPSISKKVLESLELTIPNIETQKIILDITNLRNKEKLMKHEIETLREKQIQQQIINAIK